MEASAAISGEQAPRPRALSFSRHPAPPRHPHAPFRSQAPPTPHGFTCPARSFVKADLEAVNRSATPWVVAGFHRMIYGTCTARTGRGWGAQRRTPPCAGGRAQPSLQPLKPCPAPLLPFQPTA